ncbi:MAG: hypothetical protein WC291_00200 [Thermodesulfovibrionales bacterium]
MIFSDEPIDVQQDFDNWEPAPEFAPPPPAGTYQTYLSEIRDEKEGDTPVGKRLTAVVDLRIIGGDNDDRAITWQRVSNRESEYQGKRRSQMLDLLKCAGVAQAPRSNREFSVALHSVHDRGKGAPFKTQIDWRGFCTTCYEKRLMELTGGETVEIAKSLASNLSQEQRKALGKFATKAKNYRAFPAMDGDKAGRKDTFICPDCGDEVRAQVNISRFLP